MRGSDQSDVLVQLQQNQTFQHLLFTELRRFKLLLIQSSLCITSIHLQTKQIIHDS